MLGDESVKQDIIDLLQNKQKSTREYYLLLGLAEITPLDEFNQLLEQLELDASNKEKAKKYALFRKSPVDQQAELAQELLVNGDTTLKRAAVNYLVKTKNAEALAAHWKQSNDLVRSTVKRAGYIIHIDDKDASFEAIENHTDNTDKILIALVILVIMAGLVLFIRKQKPTTGVK